MRNVNTAELLPEEINIITEALLFAFSVDVCAEWSFEIEEKMLEILKKLKKISDHNIQLENIYVMDIEPDNYWKVNQIQELFEQLKTKKVL